MEKLTLEQQLALLLLAYESDEPHWLAPNDNDNDSEYYPMITWEEFSKWLTSEHCGDCNKQPQPCLRCHAEYTMHKAKWIAAMMKI